MKYSKNYAKLNVSNYTTIRRYPKGKIGNIILEKYPSGEHYAKIIKIERKALDDIYLTDLIFDTDCDTRKEAYELIQSFYKKPIDFQNEKLYIYKLRKMKLKECYKCKFAHKFSPNRNTCYCSLLDFRVNCKGQCILEEGK